MASGAKAPPDGSRPGASTNPASVVGGRTGAVESARIRRQIGQSSGEWCGASGTRGPPPPVCGADSDTQEACGSGRYPCAASPCSTCNTPVESTNTPNSANGMTRRFRTKGISTLPGFGSLHTLASAGGPVKPRLRRSAGTVWFRPSRDPRLHGDKEAGMRADWSRDRTAAGPVERVRTARARPRVGAAETTLCYRGHG